MSDGPHQFEALIERELREAERVAREDDERMAAACRGDPFWGVDKTAPDPTRLVGLFDAEAGRFDAATERYQNWRLDQMRNMLGLPAQHAFFTGPTPRKHYSRRERRRRRWL